MKMKKKIRETAEEILQEYTSCYSEVDEDCLVNMLNRLASDVAMEVFGNIESFFHEDDFGDLTIDFMVFQELKKKYKGET